eukprot:5634997-Prymnesium_polylepis.1
MLYLLLGPGGGPGVQWRPGQSQSRDLPARADCGHHLPTFIPCPSAPASIVSSADGTTTAALLAPATGTAGS